ncbi:MAG: hypothetical protein EO766_16985 [Hydrotalea sp. AMD]|uniref:hypothetical protein n=1 Tax=Hydrotalea sp. AMD TaxID=2501297 RepID=UPI0010258DF4|nr:hypothetical protein [Hydrotalea sp. AMD]RWZ84881.1 MAG: hypothetical protein EO766_16985 [Hydrotalea sp. AMD]
MDGIDTQALKKYWPYAVGVLGVFFLYSRLKGGNSQAAQNPVIGSAVDPAIVQSNNQLAGAMAQIQGNVAIAAIQGKAQSDTAQFAAVAQGFDTLSQVSNATVQSSIASYQATKDISAAAVSAGAEVTKAGLDAAGQSTAAFANAVGNLGIATGNIVSSVGQANAGVLGGIGQIVSGAFGTNAAPIVLL